MKGCLTAIGVLLLIIFSVWLFSNIWVFIGLVITGWGIYEWRINKKLKARSKMPASIVVIGLILIFSTVALSGEDELQTTNNVENNEDNDSNESTIESSSEEPNDKEQVDKNTESESSNENKQQEQEKNKEKTNQGANPELVSATVTNVVDGDTVDVNLNGKKERLRLLLVDTPETVHPNQPVQPFGPEASQFAKETLSGQEVQLEFDGPERDNYDRFLIKC
mgnify:CR=1 FL=1